MKYLGEMCTRPSFIGRPDGSVEKATSSEALLVFSNPCQRKQKNQILEFTAFLFDLQH